MSNVEVEIRIDPELVAEWIAKNRPTTVAWGDEVPDDEEYLVDGYLQDVIDAVMHTAVPIVTGAVLEKVTLA